MLALLPELVRFEEASRAISNAAMDSIVPSSAVSGVSHETLIQSFLPPTLVVADDSLKKLYEWFDRLYDLPPESQQKELDALRSSGDAMVLELEGLLAHSRDDHSTEMPFSLNEILDACEDEGSVRLATDLRELASKMVWDSKVRGFRISNYILRRSLSVSALGATYLAYDEPLDREVVILLAFPRWGNKPAVRKRMLESARAVAKIANPHVAAILGTTELDGQVVILRQWIPGTSLATAVGKKETLNFRDTVALGAGIAKGLQAIHEERVIHGDLKPSNIILRGDRWHPVITDFGTATWIAADGESSWQGGTAGFIAPEILKGKAPTIQSDLYSLGVILFWLATGQYRDRIPGAFAPSDWPVRSIRWPSTLDPKMTKSFMMLVDRMHASEPSARPSSAAEVAESLEAMVGAMQSVQVVSENTDRLTNDNAHFPSLDTNGGASQFRSSLKRRAFVAHSFGLLATAGASMWGGSALGKRWAAPQRNLDTFVPGWDPKYKLALEVDNENHTAENWDSPLITRSIRVSNIPIDLVVPKQPNHWVAVYAKPITLPDDEMLITLINGSVEFNCNPGQAEFVLESKLATERTWTKLVSFRNHFGGLFGRAFDASLPRYQVRPNELVSLRARVRYRGAAVVADAYPVGICLGLVPFTSFMSLGVWCRKEGG